VIVADIVVLTEPEVGVIEETVDAVALLTVNVVEVVPPSEFRTTSVQVPGAIPFRLKFLLNVVDVSVSITVEGTVDCPVIVRVTFDPLKPVPVITIVWDPLFAALVGDLPEMVNDPAVPTATNGTAVRDPVVAVSVFVPAVVLIVQLVRVAMPLEPVVIDPPAGNTEPLPEAAVNVTTAPLTGLPNASFTITLGAVATAEPVAAD
jgi:hypothetical protein